jgi:hypothetical protein
MVFAFFEQEGDVKFQPLGASSNYNLTAEKRFGSFQLSSLSFLPRVELICSLIAGPKQIVESFGVKCETFKVLMNHFESVEVSTV